MSCCKCQDINVRLQCHVINVKFKFHSTNAKLQCQVTMSSYKCHVEKSSYNVLKSTVNGSEMLGHNKMQSSLNHKSETNVL